MKKYIVLFYNCGMIMSKTKSGNPVNAFAGASYGSPANDLELFGNAGRPDITKTINGVYGPYGAPSFLFGIEGADMNRNHHIWHRIITLSEQELSGSVVQEDIVWSEENGSITELDVSRYGLSAITGEHIRYHLNSEQTKEVTEDLYNHGESQTVYESTLGHFEKWSHVTERVNRIQAE